MQRCWIFKRTLRGFLCILCGCFYDVTPPYHVYSVQAPFGGVTVTLVDPLIVEKSKLDEDKKGEDVDRHTIVAALTRGQKDLSVSKRNRQSRTIVSEGFLRLLYHHLHMRILLVVRYTPLAIWCLQFWEIDLLASHQKGRKAFAISSTEAEFYCFVGCCAQVLWMRSQLTDYGLGFNKIPMYRENKSAFFPYAATSLTFQIEHIDIDFTVSRRHVQNGRSDETLLCQYGVSTGGTSLLKLLAEKE
ncbi:hypothetical protein Tco_0010960 [Tanacetum coccineum]